MTTAHRATFTHAKAKDNSLTQSYEASLTHERALPSHTKLKYRKEELKNNDDDDDDDDQTEENEEDRLSKLKQKLIEKESKLRRKTNELSIGLIADMLESREDKNEKEDDENNKVYQIIGGKFADEINGEKSEVEDSESEEESEDEDELLLAELAQIKKERAEKKESEILEHSKSSNPLIQLTNSEELSFSAPKRSWRSNTLFSNKKQKLKNDKKNKLEYTNDTLNSSKHQEFLGNYIK